jgi:spermidine synthase
MVDGYDADSHAEELATRAFYGQCARRLSPAGIFVVNLWGGDREFDTLLRRVERSFPEGTICLPAEKPGNVIVFGFKTHPGNLTWQALNERAAELQSAYGLEFPRFVEGLRKMNPHDAERLLLKAASKS